MSEDLEQVVDTEQPQETGTPEQPTVQQLMDLDSLEKFRFGGQEMTPKDLRDSQLRYADYTRKTKELAEERRSHEKERSYYENLYADLETVKQRPDLVEKFKTTYPEKFHAYLDKALGTTDPEKTEGKEPSIPKEFLDRFDRLESDLNERKVQAINAELDHTFKALATKYPMADEESMIARGQALLARGEKLTSEVWEQIAKSVHDKFQKVAEAHYAEKIKKQTTANSQGRDIGNGGSTPDTAPHRPRRIKEAADLAMREAEAS